MAKEIVYKRKKTSLISLFECLNFLDIFIKHLWLFFHLFIAYDLNDFNSFLFRRFSLLVTAMIFIVFIETIKSFYVRHVLNKNIVNKWFFFYSFFYIQLMKPAFISRNQFRWLTRNCHTGATSGFCQRTEYCFA